MSRQPLGAVRPSALLLAAALLGPALPAEAQRPPASQAEAQAQANRIVAVVNGDVVSRADVIGRARLFALNAGLAVAPEVLDRLAPQVTRLLAKAMALEPAQRYQTPAAEFGHKLYVVKAEQRSDVAGTVVGAGIGWLQWADRRGCFVEHELEVPEGSCDQVEAALRGRIISSLRDLAATRGHAFSEREVQTRVIATKVEHRPACALVLAVYQAEGWAPATHRVTDESRREASEVWSTSDFPYACLKDVERTLAFRRAIRQVVRRGDRVVDAGAGSGILSFFAVEAGADQVFAVEIAPSLVSALRLSVALNELEDRVVVVPGNAVEVDLPRDVDVVIGELMETGLMDETQVAVMNSLRERGVIGPHSRLIPDRYETAIELVDVFRADVQRYRFKWGERIFSIGMSVGMVAINATSRTSARLLSAADTACYMAKDRGRNRIHVYESRDSELVRHRGEMQWITQIYKAMEENRLRLTWQAIYRIQGDLSHNDNPHPRHVELLLRMQQEDGSEILPMAFIPAAERYLIMPTLDTWVIEETLRICQRYRASCDDRHCLFAVNLSGSSLKDPAFRSVLLSALRNQPEAGPQLCFEITETATLGNLAVVNDFIHAMREFGCRFALDDFGSGLSSFTYLKNLKVDFLKIDGAFVRDIATNPLDRSMVDAIFRIGHQMGVVTIAEYVETDQVLAILRQIGVECGQGNLLHAPQAMDAFWKNVGGPAQAPEA